MKSILLALSIAIGLTLQGCGSVVLPTVAKLNSLSLLEVDPAGLEIAVDIPEGGDVIPNGVKIEIALARDGHEEAYDNTYYLQRRDAADGRVLFRINPAELEEIREIQSRASAWLAEDPDGTTGRFEYYVETCRYGAGPEEGARFSISIRTEVDGPFMPLIRNARVTDAIALIEGLEEELESPEAYQCE